MFCILFENIFIKLDRYYKTNYKYINHDNNESDNIKLLELKAGPEYLFHLKTASLNAVLFTSVVLGVAFPYFYLIAILAITVQYLVERYTLAMFYRLPPKFSLNLTQANN